jgi:hypothetical protein
MHCVHTRFRNDLHNPVSNLTKFQNGMYCSGINIFNNLPHHIKDIANEIKWLRNAFLKILLQTHLIFVNNILIIGNKLVKTDRQLSPYYCF